MSLTWNGGPLVAPDEPDEPAPPTLEERVRDLETRLALVEAALEEPEEDATAEATADLVQRTLAVLAGRR